MARHLISLHVIPKASCSEIIGWVRGADGLPVLKVRVNAPPEDGKANKALIRFLAKQWGVAPSVLQLAGGETSRHKRLQVGPDALYQRLIKESQGAAGD